MWGAIAPDALPDPGGAALTSDHGRPPGLTWNYTQPELWADGVVHVVGIALGSVGAVLLVALAATEGGTAELASVAVYAAGLVGMLGISAAYNMLPVSRLKWRLRSFDHAAIFVMIAGTYTPFAARMEGSLSVALLVWIWSMAGFGVALKILLPGRFDRVSIALYLLMSWSIVLAWDAVVASLPATTVRLLAAGGMVYTAGVAFHVWESLRFQNAIWHGFVLLAAACHFGAVLDCTVLARA
jgi:hemolysin III